MVVDNKITSGDISMTQAAEVIGKVGVGVGAWVYGTAKGTIKSAGVAVVNETITNPKGKISYVVNTSMGDIVDNAETAAIETITSSKEMFKLNFGNDNKTEESKTASSTNNTEKEA